MRTLLWIALGFLLGGLAAGIGWGLVRPGAAAPVAAPVQKQYWTCGMHPQVHEERPGNCPICGMKLVPERRSASSDAVNPDAIAIDPVTIQNMGVRTAPVTRGPLRRVIRSAAAVDYDEAQLAVVTTKYRGWIEKLYANRSGQVLRQGEPLFEIYAPELYSAQTEYLLALAGAAGEAANPLLASARTRLEYLDVSPAQIAALEKARTASKTLPVTAPRDGIVVEKMLVEGQMVEAGMPLLRIADLRTVWVLAQVFEPDLPLLRAGQEVAVKFSARPDALPGLVSYVYPTVDDRTRTGRVRVELPNPGLALKPGMFASVEIRVEVAADAVLVPEQAVLRSGNDNHVFVALAGGRFEPRPVTLGGSGEGGLCQVLSGLQPGETVVTSAQFLLDSESRLRAGMAKMTPPPAGTSAPVPAPPAVPAAAAWYVCPMDEHADVLYNKPGECPRCAMKLVPAAPASGHSHP